MIVSSLKKTAYIAAVLMIMFLAFKVHAVKIIPEDKPVTDGRPLKTLRKIYLVIHPLYWIDIEPQSPAWQDRFIQEFPGKYELARAREFQLRNKYRELIAQAGEDEGMLFVPNNGQACAQLRDFARKHFGKRLVVLEDEKGVGIDENIRYMRAAIGANLDKALLEGLSRDWRQAVKNRGHCWKENILEWGCWQRVKAWKYFFDKALKDRGYTYDPAVTEFEAWGGNWNGCAATYPILMSRILGLAKPINRRFDLINPDSSPVLLKAELVEQNIPMPGGVRLFIFKTVDEGPTWGRYIAQYYEGKHGIMDRPRVVEVKFPFNSVMEITQSGWSKGRSLGVYDKRRESIEMSVGCGGHSYHPVTLVMADDEVISFDEFRAALTAGKVKNEPGLFSQFRTKVYASCVSSFYYALKERKMTGVYYRLKNIKDRIKGM